MARIASPPSTLSKVDLILFGVGAVVLVLFTFLLPMVNVTFPPFGLRAQAPKDWSYTVPSHTKSYIDLTHVGGHPLPTQIKVVFVIGNEGDPTAYSVNLRWSERHLGDETQGAGRFGDWVDYISDGYTTRTVSTTLIPGLSFYSFDIRLGIKNNGDTPLYVRDWMVVVTYSLWSSYLPGIVAVIGLVGIYVGAFHPTFPITFRNRCYTIHVVTEPIPSPPPSPLPQADISGEELLARIETRLPLLAESDDLETKQYLERFRTQKSRYRGGKVSPTEFHRWLLQFDQFIIIHLAPPPEEPSPPAILARHYRPTQFSFAIMVFGPLAINYTIALFYSALWMNLAYCLVLMIQATLPSVSVGLLLWALYVVFLVVYSKKYPPTESDDEGPTSPSSVEDGRKAEVSVSDVNTE